MESSKFYCPYCDLRLSGSTHADRGEAWDLYHCEYNVERSDKRPVTELERNNRMLAELNKDRDIINKNIWSLKVGFVAALNKSSIRQCQQGRLLF
ncbi:hypothetical protein [Moritella viscosa]|uniref:Uncharacterized protein n=1 Tax=Moritella viscosa TaxID=80854 RepID=A0A1L0ARH7_9GAMM|nr:hypothetical protein [Moritella viscosa]SGZ19640.1 Putative uncharacterized protein [Moritella viscosa]